MYPSKLGAVDIKTSWAGRINAFSNASCSCQLDYNHHGKGELSPFVSLLDMANKLLFFLSHHILLMDNYKDSAEYASRLNTSSLSSKCLMSSENIRESSSCTVECCSMRHAVGIQQSVAEYLSVGAFCSVCVLKKHKKRETCYKTVYWGEMCLLSSRVLLLESHNWHSKQL